VLTHGPALLGLYSQVLVIFSTLGCFATRLWLIQYTKSHAIGSGVGGACHQCHQCHAMPACVRRMVCRVCARSGLLTSVSISIFAAIYSKIAANLNTWENYQKPTQFEDAMVRPRAGTRPALCRLR
jgi:hypothetical protein